MPFCFILLKKARKNKQKIHLKSCNLFIYVHNKTVHSEETSVCHYFYWQNLVINVFCYFVILKNPQNGIQTGNPSFNRLQNYRILEEILQSFLGSTYNIWITNTWMLSSQQYFSPLWNKQKNIKQKTLDYNIPWQARDCSTNSVATL